MPNAMSGTMTLKRKKRKIQELSGLCAFTWELKLTTRIEKKTASLLADSRQTNKDKRDKASQLVWSLRKYVGPLRESRERRCVEILHIASRTSSTKPGLSLCTQVQLANVV